MPRLALLVALVLIAFPISDTARLTPDEAGDPASWRFVSGKAPTRAELAAVVGTCEVGAIRAMRHRPLEDCLANLGLRRLQ